MILSHDPSQTGREVPVVRASSGKAAAQAGLWCGKPTAACGIPAVRGRGKSDRVFGEEYKTAVQQEMDYNDQTTLCSCLFLIYGRRS